MGLLVHIHLGYRIAHEGEVEIHGDAGVPVHPDAIVAGLHGPVLDSWEARGHVVHDRLLLVPCGVHLVAPVFQCGCSIRGNASPCKV